MSSCVLPYCLLLLITIGSIQAKEECYSVRGKVQCAAGPTREPTGIRVDLLDEDSLPFEKDDLMGRAWADEHGFFLVTGCGADFGPLNTPDPYLKIVHHCPPDSNGQPSTDEKTFQVGFIPLPMPHINRLGTIYLE